MSTCYYGKTHLWNFVKLVIKIKTVRLSWNGCLKSIVVVIQGFHSIFFFVFCSFSFWCVPLLVTFLLFDYFNFTAKYFDYFLSFWRKLAPVCFKKCLRCDFSIHGLVDWVFFFTWPKDRWLTKLFICWIKVVEKKFFWDF